jgi:hypothetical protein
MLTPAYALTATERVLPRATVGFTSGSLDPRVTFTRSGNTATVTNVDGSITIANADTPRFQYLNGVCQGLLVEETRTNLFVNSIMNGFITGSPGTPGTSYTNIVTTGSISAIVTSDYAAGFGIELTCTVQRRTFRQRYSSIATNTTYSFSADIDVKSGFFQIYQYMILQSIPAGATSVYLLNGVVVTPTTFVPLGKNKIAMVLTTVGAGGITDFVFGLGGQSNVTGVCVFSNLQLEVGPAPSSYIPTTTVAVQRNPDIATMTGTNFSDWWVAGTGAAVVRGRQAAAVGVCPWLQFDDGTANNLMQLRGNTTNPELYIKATTDQATIDAGTVAANTLSGFTAAWATNNCAAAFNGSAAGTDTSATIPTVTQARIGSDGTNYLNGTLQDIRYWPQRLIDAEVQAFSKV